MFSGGISDWGTLSCLPLLLDSSPSQAFSSPKRLFTAAEFAGAGLGDEAGWMFLAGTPGDVDFK